MINNIVKKYKSGADFCRTYGIKNQQFLYSIMHGDRKVPYTLALKIHRLLGTPLYEIRPDIYPPDIFKSKNKND